MKRNCGSCTKCCEGWLSGEVDGKKFYKGIGCHNCIIGNGCAIYEDRPEDPCRTFSCSWLDDESVPEWMKPELSNVIVYEKNIENNLAIVFIPAGGTVPLSTFSWFMIWATKKYQNIIWQNEAGSQFYLGTNEFCETMLRNKI